MPCRHGCRHAGHRRQGTATPHTPGPHRPGPPPAPGGKATGSVRILLLHGYIEYYFSVLSSGPDGGSPDSARPRPGPAGPRPASPRARRAETRECGGLERPVNGDASRDGSCSAVPPQFNSRIRYRTPSARSSARACLGVCGAECALIPFPTPPIPRRPPRAGHRRFTDGPATEGPLRMKEAQASPPRRARLDPRPLGSLVQCRGLLLLS